MKKKSSENKTESIHRHKRSKFMTWLLKPGTVLILLIFAGLIGNNYYENKYIVPKTQKEKIHLEQEFQQLHLIENSKEIDIKKVTKERFTTISAGANTNEDWDAFYYRLKQTAQNNGWSLKREVTSGKYHHIEFLKNEYYMDVGYNMSDEIHDYSIELKWDYNDKDKNYLLP